MKNSADLGGCYPPRPSASVDNTLLDLQNSSYPTQPHSIFAKCINLLSVILCSGETAFKNMTIPYGWARHPMIYRIGSVDKNIPITMIYGSRSWIDHSTGKETKERRSGCYVDVQVITGAGHHVYVDQPNKFNELVEHICQNVDGDDNNGDDM